MRGRVRRSKAILHCFFFECLSKNVRILMAISFSKILQRMDIGRYC